MDALTQGRVHYRSGLLEQEEAEDFAAYLRKRPEFTDVTLRENVKTKADNPKRWVVYYQPAHQTRQAELLAKEVRARLTRALKEGESYVWHLDRTHPLRPFWRVQTTKGSTYEIGPHGEDCTCEDYVMRCKRADIPCKHLLAFGMALGTKIKD
jgi:predicted nucleic acid-binding Zn finger protein